MKEKNSQIISTCEMIVSNMENFIQDFSNKKGTDSKNSKLILTMLQNIVFNTSFKREIIIHYCDAAATLWYYKDMVLSNGMIQHIYEYRGIITYLYEKKRH